MKRHEKSIGKILEQHLPLASAEQMESAGERVLQRLRSETDGITKEAPADFDFVRPVWTLRRPGIAAAAAAVVIVALVLVWRSGPRAVLETADGRSHRIWYGETVRSNGVDGSVLVLRDGSRIEMRSQSEIVLEPAGDGDQVRLDRGSVIVSAAEQRDGHLYVKTKDCTVSVAGTVFLVNAEDAGSRVAVIQGEVQVQQGAALDRLLPGEQLATAPSMKSLSVSDEIAWSRNAAALRALLKQLTARPRVEFEVATIKFDDPINGILDSPFAGLACHGTDGIRRAAFGSADFAVPKGKCVGGHVPLAHLIGFAHGVPRWRVYGGPDWLQSTNYISFQGFQIETKAKSPSTATTAQLAGMLQALLADRFKVRFHRETQETEGYALVVGKEGPKFKEAPSVEEAPRRIYEKDQFIIKGKSSMNRLVDFLSGPEFGLAVVLDKTEMTGNYDYALTLNPAAGGRFDPSIAAALQAQLGLRLEPHKVPVEVIVVDHAEKPSEN